MTTYPSVNWWPGNLRPYESRLSVVIRFQALNGISSRRCLNFLNVAPDPDLPLPHEEAVRLSEILHEALPDVLAIFSPSIVFENCGHYAPPPNRRDRHRVRYCDACAQRGYHSYLHELSWISRCPFHMCELKDAWVGMHADSVAAGHMAALNVVMQERCRSWPHCDNSFPSGEDKYLSLLGDWVTRASLAAESLSRREIWRSGDDGFPGDLSLAQAFGQLRALVPMPEAIETLFAEAGDAWGMETCQFPQQTRIKLERFRSRGLGFARIFDFYKCIGAFSAARPSFVTRAWHAQDSLRERHGICRCEWELTVEGWHHNWVKVHAEERKHWSFRCPFDVAIGELDLCWAHRNSAYVGRNPSPKRVIFVELAHDMHAAGLIRYAKGSKITTKGSLNTEQEIASCCEWVHDSVLSDLLEKAADWEVEAAHNAVSRWLDNIDHGLQPGQRDDPKHYTRLCETDDGLSLIRWVKNSKRRRPFAGVSPRTGWTRNQNNGVETNKNAST
ncbi:hypothetical protein P5W99_36985 [Paraburkholderia sp. A3BS-1L]|uniref:hypothetical protein n=1 Tax=Paraburkholderia sp. A3BS-1L TaxID=3028375 RepID=UPI003DA915D9